MTWRAIQTKPAAEKRVTAALKDEGVQAYLPLEHVWRYRRGRKTQHAHPLIRGYVFAFMQDDALHLIHGIDGATRYVGVRGGAATIPSEFVIELMEAQANGVFDHTATKTKRFERGAQVRLTSGPYAGRIAAFAKLKDSRRAQILLSVAGRQWSVTADMGQLEAA